MRFVWSVIPFDKTLDDSYYTTGLGTFSHRILNYNPSNAVFKFVAPYMHSFDKRKEQLAESTENSVETE